ncbi:MAG: ring-cleaving dioxygenase [Thermoleophilia bacterium]|nr:ring-cleaving dioxygenase [Thermoleophilia bacterium]
MHPLEGIHHISAITGNAQQNLAFYTGTLGLRLVAKSVNQDDPSVYHLFYGDEEGHYGADMTFFEYPGAIPGRAGAGMVHRVVWRVGSTAAIDFWEQRFAAQGVEAARAGDSIRFSDPEGLDHEFVVTDAPDEPRTAVHPEIPREFALQGFEGVRIYSHDEGASIAMLVNLMGAVKRSDGAYELRGQERGGWVAFDPAPQLPANQSAGTVHHVAFGLLDDQYDDWTQYLRDEGVPGSGPVDRTYFESLYYREPGGVLYELATAGPGFTVDGPVETLGERIILPPQFEPHRAQIEAILTPLPKPRADWPVGATAGSQA